MIELPEARTIAKDLRKEIIGKKIMDVKGNFTDHKFTFYNKDPKQYKSLLINQVITDVIDRNVYVEIIVGKYQILFRDGANIRYYQHEKDFVGKSKLMLLFEDGSMLNVTTSMYCFIAVFETGKEFLDDSYYNMELTRFSVFDPEFTFAYFKSLRNEETKKLSVKAFLATEQRIPGIGNGVVQDILFMAKLHPKRKVNTLTELEFEQLYHATIDVVTKMTHLGGRDTEKTIYGKIGGYPTILSNQTYRNPCPNCHGEIKKENFLGGTIYVCPGCQK